MKLNITKEMYLFLSHIIELFEKDIEFSKKHKNDGIILTDILNVQVEMSIYWKGKYKRVHVYDKERKVFCTFSLKDLTKIRDKFVSYCENQKFDYK